jgi:hypothetical protein
VNVFMMGAKQDRLAGSRRVELPGSKRRYREENLVNAKASNDNFVPMAIAA